MKRRGALDETTQRRLAVRIRVAFVQIGQQRLPDIGRQHGNEVEVLLRRLMRPQRSREEQPYPWSQEEETNEGTQEHAPQHGASRHIILLPFLIEVLFEFLGKRTRLGTGSRMVNGLTTSFQPLLRAQPTGTLVHGILDDVLV
jgi:hypothetical protein